MKNVKADKHYGYHGSGEGQTLENGQRGIDRKKGVLVVCCSNCGNYSHIDLKEIGKGKAK